VFGDPGVVDRLRQDLPGAEMDTVGCGQVEGEYLSWKVPVLLWMVEVGLSRILSDMIRARCGIRRPTFLGHRSR
jgi:hypothetical protein